MTRNPFFRLIFVVFFATLYLGLLALPVVHLAHVDVLSGFAVGMTGLLVVLIRDLPGISRMPEFSRKMLLAGAVASGLLYILATRMDSSALQLIGLGMFAVVWLACLLPRPQMGGLLVLIGLICLPSVFLNSTLLLSLQQLASAMAFRALDLIGVASLNQTGILETKQGSLFFGEACGDMESMVTGLVVSQVYFCWRKKGLIFSLVGLLCCSALLLLGNSLRIFLSGWIYAANALDLTQGWKQEMAGVGVYLLVLALLPSLSSVMDGIGGMYLRWRKPGKKRFGKGPKLRVMARRSLKELLLEDLPRPLFVVVALMVMSAVAEALVFSGEEAAVEIDLEKHPLLSEIILPAELAGWRQAPGEGEGEGGASFGGKNTLEQRVWTFRKGGSTTWVVVDLPVDELHPLRLCDTYRDWAIVRESEIVLANQLPFSYLKLRSKENTRAPMRVYFGNYDLSDGRFFGGPPGRLTSGWETILASLKDKRSQFALTGKGPFCQLQLVQSGVVDHQFAGGAETMELLAAVRDSLAGQIHPN